MNVDQKIIEKIRKCLALAQSSEPHEAAAAMRQAQKLMAAHGVTAEGIADADIGEESANTYTISKLRRWETTLAGIMSRAFGCKVIFARGYGRRLGTLTFIGIKHQAQLAKYTWEVLYRQILKDRAAYLKVNGNGIRAMDTQRGDDFCLGYALALDKKVSEFANEPKIQALIDARTRKHTGNNEQKVQAKDKGKQVGAAYFDGREKAADAQLHRPMEGQKQRMLGNGGSNQ